MAEYENWLHRYRKLHREDLLKFCTQSQNFTDSQLKFRRNHTFLLKRLYLVY